MTAASVRRVFGTVKAITNLAIREYGLACPNVFANVFIPDDEKASTRLPIPDDNLLAIQKECVEMDDDVRWLKPRVADGCVIHSFRNSLRDRLRRVECPSDIADAIGGWATAGVGQKYGSGYGLEVKARWMERIVVRAPWTDNRDA